MATRVIGITQAGIAIPSAATTGAYATGQVIGGSNTVTNICNRQQGTLTIQSMRLADLAGQSAAMDIFFFRSAPTATDKAAFAPTDAQLRDCVGVVSIGSGDYVSGGTGKSVATLRNIGLAMNLGVSTPAASNAPETKNTTIFVVFVSRGTPNYGASAATNLNLEILAFVD